MRGCPLVVTVIVNVLTLMVICIGEENTLGRRNLFMMEVIARVGGIFFLFSDLGMDLNGKRKSIVA